MSNQFSGEVAHIYYDDTHDKIASGKKLKEVKEIRSLQKRKAPKSGQLRTWRAILLEGCKGVRVGGRPMLEPRTPMDRVCGGLFFS